VAYIVRRDFFADHSRSASRPLGPQLEHLTLLDHRPASSIDGRDHRGLTDHSEGVESVDVLRHMLLGAMKVLEGLKAIEPGSAVPVAELGLPVTGGNGLLLVFWKST
jgi:hypothetical protein